MRYCIRDSLGAESPDIIGVLIQNHPASELAFPEPVEPPGGRRRRLAFWAGAATVVLALGSALATFSVLAGLTPFAPTHDTVLLLFLINALLILIMIGFVAVEGFRLLRARRAGQAAAGLHVRIVGLFAFVATLPALLVAALGWITLERGIDISFSRTIQQLLTTSVDVATSYRELQCRTMGREINLMASDISRARQAAPQANAFFQDFMRSRALFLGFPVAILLKSDLQIVERIELKPVEGLTLPSPEDMNAAADTEAWCLIPQSGNVFRALIKVPGIDDLYLFTARPVDPKALEFPIQAERAAAFYGYLAERKLDVQVAFASMYALISLILLLSATWFGLSFANRLVAPIRRLIHATDQVASGNFYVQVPVGNKEGDLGHLAETFNKMTAELRRQTDRLTAASELIDRRRRFTEAVLSGVSAGVIGVDAKGRITVVNPSADKLLGGSRETVLGKPILEIMPDLAPWFTRDVERTRGQGTLVVGTGDSERVLTVRVTTENATDGEQGSIVTLDDISELVTAQRTSAWADVARRIAHEIKNPLTPIQLSAERLKRKYGRLITTDKEVFDQCTDTIVRQVDDIKRMVDEFSSFARMPKPRPEDDDVSEMVKQVAFLMRVGHPELQITDHLPAHAILAKFDRRLLSQALTNIVKNATEAISAIDAETRGGPGRIDVTLIEDEAGIVSISVQDNGKGFPQENRARLLEPYMTTHEGGTGLGLAIVGKILEDHGGGIELLDPPDGSRGAIVRLWFPREGAADAPQSEPTDNLRHMGSGA